MPAQSPAAMMFFLISKSPVLARVLLAAIKHHECGEKALLLTDGLWVQQ